MNLNESKIVFIGYLSAETREAVECFEGIAPERKKIICGDSLLHSEKVHASFQEDVLLVDCISQIRSMDPLDIWKNGIRIMGLRTRKPLGELAMGVIRRKEARMVVMVVGEYYDRLMAFVLREENPVLEIRLIPSLRFFVMEEKKGEEGASPVCSTREVAEEERMRAYIDYSYNKTHEKGKRLVFPDITASRDYRRLLEGI